MNTARILSSWVIMTLGLALPSTAHELFLKPADHHVKPDAVTTIGLFNGTFGKSDNVVDRDRMLDVRVHGGGATRHPDADQWRDKGKTSYLSHAVAGDGTYAIGVSTRPRLIQMTAKDFADYLKHDGVVDTLATFDMGDGSKIITERYSKHVRAILQVGDMLSDEHEDVFGYPVEIVLQNNPGSLHVGDELAFQVLRNRAPLANQVVYASHAGYEASHGAGRRKHAIMLRTDAGGRATFNVTTSGIWYLTLIHMEKLTQDPDVDYESNWSTVTFQID